MESGDLVRNLKQRIFSFLPFVWVENLLVCGQLYLKNCSKQELTRYGFGLTFLGSFDVHENSSSRFFIRTRGNEHEITH